MKGWQRVYRDELEYRAEIVKDFLNNHEITAIILPKKDSAYQFGHYEVHVKRDDILRAIKLLEDDIRFD